MPSAARRANDQNTQLETGPVAPISRGTVTKQISSPTY